MSQLLTIRKQKRFPRRRQVARRGFKPVPMISHPPQFISNPTQFSVFRFRSTNAAPTVINGANFLTVPGAICITANTTLSAIARAFRIHSVEVWTPSSGAAAATTVSLQWSASLSGSTFTKTSEVSDTSVSQAEPAHIRALPPAGTLQAQWMDESIAENMFTLTAPVGSIIDVRLSYVLLDGTASTVPYTVAAGTLGVMYYTPLDGSTDVYLPVGRVTTT